MAGGEVIGNLAGGERRCFLKDHLGSVRTTVDRNGNVVGHDDYCPFGLAMPGRSLNSANPNDHYKFTGYELDNEAGLTVYHANARGYDPVLGRFLQIDPLSDLFPHVSSYAYGNNNPLRFTDPTGMAPYDWIKNLETDEYVWDSSVNSAEDAPEGFEYIGKSIRDVRNDFLDSRPWYDFSNLLPSGLGIGSKANITYNDWPGEVNSYEAANVYAKTENLIEGAPLAVKIPANAVYNTFDAFYTTLQRGSSRTSLSGSSITGWRITDNSVKTMLTLVPYGRIGSATGLQKLNAAQFSSQFKGTFIPKLSPAYRGFLNKQYNRNYVGQIGIMSKILYNSSQNFNN